MQNVTEFLKWQPRRIIMEPNGKEVLSMIQGFKRSRIASTALMAFSIFISVVIWFRDKDYPVFIPLIASTLMIAIGFFSSRVLGNVLASMENTRYLGYLHMELDPAKFLDAYKDVPGRMKPDSSDAAICRSYLADGYAAAGDYETALQLLSEETPPGNLPVKGLYAANRAACLLHMEKPEAAAKALEELEQVIDACRLSKADLAKNLTGSLTLYREFYHCLVGMDVDVDHLTDAFQRAQYNIRRLEIAKILALYYLREGNTGEAKKQLSYLRKNGGKSAYKRWADTR